MRKGYTVEHHEPPPPDVPPLPVYDAARSSMPPQPSKEKLRRVLMEEAKREAHRTSRLPAYTKASWDSPRPAGGNLPHFE